MRLRYKIHLFSLVIPAAMAVAIVIVGTIVINGIVYRFHRDILFGQIAQVKKAMQDKWQILEDAGVEKLPHYVAAAQNDLFDDIRKKRFRVSGHLFVLSVDGQILYHPALPDSVENRFPFPKTILKTPSDDFTFEIGKMSYYSVYDTFPQWDWIIGLSVATDRMFEQRKEYLEIVSVIVVVILFLSLSFSFIFSIRLVRRIDSTLACVEQVGRGDLSARIANPEVQDELGALQRGVNAMIAEVEARTREQKQAEDALRESEKQYRLLAENASDVIWTIDLDMRYTYLSPSVERLAGYTPDELIGKDATQYITPESLAAAIEVLEEELALEKSLERDKSRSRILDLETICKDGSKIWTEVQMTFVRDESDTVVGIIGVTRDIKQRRELETQLRQAQKMEAIGTLAGGIAHDFNNILAAIMGYAEIAGFLVEPGSQVDRSLKRILKSCERAKNLVSQILSFGRQSEPERKPIRISPIVKETLELLRASLPATIAIREDLMTDADVVMADYTQIQQILMNLGSNAHHAMREKGGELTVALDAVELDDRVSVRHPDLKPGAYLTITVSDTGCGMERQILERIFEPYFSTKEKSEGTGLGLAVVHGIVKILGGAISVDSVPGRGSSFQVYLPRESEIIGIVEEKTNDSLPGGEESILFVDDEPTLAKIGKEMLERLGYEVTIQTSSAEALALFRKQPDRFDLVVTDMTMPDITGDMLAIEIMRIRSSMPIIVCTGYSERMTEAKAQALGIKAFLMKPLSVQDLAEAVRKALD